MKISRQWLQKYFDAELPKAEELSNALTFHAFEVEGIEHDDILDVKVTPDRGHDCLSHRGIAKEFSAILNLPLSSDPLCEKLALMPKTDVVSVSLDADGLCRRYVAGYIRNVKVGPSPKWLVYRLEAMGQRSINNVVDATNFVMFNMGQPLHAFDAGKLKTQDSIFKIQVRKAKAGEKMVALDNKEYGLTESMLLITDANTDAAIGIAGVKGGTPAAIDERTTDIIIESANFNGVSVRKTAQALKLRTDASVRFEQEISPELAGFGMQSVADLIMKIAGGELVGFVDAYPHQQDVRTVSVSTENINAVLGTSLSAQEIAEVFSRLGFSFEHTGQTFMVTVPFDRVDITIAENLIEEVGRIIGYDAVPTETLPQLATQPAVNKPFYWSERIRTLLLQKGFSEVFTSVFTDKGERVVLNKVDGVRPYLRDSLVPGLHEALVRNMRLKELLGLTQVNIFEIGTVWKGGKEMFSLALATEPVKKAPKAADMLAELLAELGHSDILQNVRMSSADDAEEIDLGALIETLPAPEAYEIPEPLPPMRYQSFSKYPYIVRDVAAWIPEGFSDIDMRDIISGAAGDLLVKCYQVDRFEKEGRVSAAFRLVFQSFDRTLEDREASDAMDRVHTALKADGFEVR